MSNKVIGVKFKMLVDNVSVPKYMTEGAAGFDIAINNFKTLYTSQEMCPDGIPKGADISGNNVTEMYLTPHSRILCGAGYALAIPEGYELQIRSRGGTSLKQGLVVANSPGTVDEDYRGEICLILLNTSAFRVHLKVGDRVGQGILTQYTNAHFIEVSDLDDTKRGDGAFGHTGVKSY